MRRLGLRLFLSLSVSLYLCSPLWRKSLLCSQVTNLSFGDIRLKRSGASFEPVKRQRQRCVYEKFNTCRQRKLVEASISAYVRYMANNRYFWGCEKKSSKKEREKKRHTKARNWPSFVFLTLWRASSAGLFFIFKRPENGLRHRERTLEWDYVRERVRDSS